MVPKNNPDKLFDLITLIVNKSFMLATLWIVIQFIREDRIFQLMMSNPLDAAVLLFGLFSMILVGTIPKALLTRFGNYSTPSSYDIPIQGCNYPNCKKDSNDVMR